jgi:hypothetical protein
VGESLRTSCRGAIPAGSIARHIGPRGSRSPTSCQTRGAPSPGPRSTIFSRIFGTVNGRRSCSTKAHRPWVPRLCSSTPESRSKLLYLSEGHQYNCRGKDDRAPAYTCGAPRSRRATLADFLPANLVSGGTRISSPIRASAIRFNAVRRVRSTSVTRLQPSESTLAVP